MNECHAIDVDRTGTDLFFESTQRGKSQAFRYVEDRTGADVVDFLTCVAPCVKKKYPLWAFSSGAAPLSAQLYREDNQWFADIDELNISASGETPKEVIAELELHIQHFIDFYSTLSDEALSKYARSLRDKFAQIQRTDQRA